MVDNCLSWDDRNPIAACVPAIREKLNRHLTDCPRRNVLYQRILEIVFNGGQEPICLACGSIGDGSLSKSQDCFRPIETTFPLAGLDLGNLPRGNGFVRSFTTSS